MNFLLILICVSIVGCNLHTDNGMKEVYKSREEMLSTFSHMSVFRTGTGNSVFLYTYKDGKKNEYVFGKDQGKYFLFRDKILFSPDEVLNITSKSGNPDYKQQLNQKLEFYLGKMDSLNINDVSNDFTPHGITLKVYMKSKAVLVYVTNPNSVTNPEWINYLKSMKKFDDHWYYAKQD